MTDIFISYSRADRQRISQLAAALEAHGYSVWWDLQSEAVADFSKQIEQARKQAAVTLDQL